MSTICFFLLTSSNLMYPLSTNSRVHLRLMAICLAVPLKPVYKAVRRNRGCHRTKGFSPRQNPSLQECWRTPCTVDFHTIIVSLISNRYHMILPQLPFYWPRSESEYPTSVVMSSYYVVFCSWSRHLVYQRDSEAHFVASVSVAWRETWFVV